MSSADGHNDAEFGMSWCAGFRGSFYSSCFKAGKYYHHMLISDIEDMNGAEGHGVDYDDHMGVSNISSSAVLPPSTLPAAALFNDEDQVLPSLSPQQVQHGHMAHDLFRDTLVAEGDEIYERMSLQPLECTPQVQHDAGASSNSTPLDELLLLSFPSTQQVQNDQVEYDLDDQQHLVVDDKNRSSHWDLESFAALVANQDDLIPSSCFTDLVSSPTSVFEFNDLW